MSQDPRVAKLREVFGGSGGALTDLNWAQRTRGVLAYARNPNRRIGIADYELVRQTVEDCWRLPCLETEGQVGDMGPLHDGDRELGRFSVRLLSPTRTSELHLVIRRDLAPHMKTWALLHELGHLVYHFEQFLSVSVLFKRIALRPELELEVGRFVVEKGGELVTLRERESDLFAVNWLLPPGLDEDVPPATDLGAEPGMTRDGLKVKLLRQLFGAWRDDSLSRRSLTNLNQRGAEEKRRALSTEYPLGASMYRRACWVLFNRPQLQEVDRSQTASLVKEYFELVGYPPRRLRELFVTRPTSYRSRGSVTSEWIRRVSREQVSRQVDGTQWGPLLVGAGASCRAPFYIPIRPVRSRNPHDSELGWQHLFSASLSVPRPLEHWLERGRSQKAGVLVFGRSPAERMLDTQEKPSTSAVFDRFWSHA